MKILGSRGIDLGDLIKVGLTSESMMKTTYTIDPIPRNIPNEEIKIGLGCIFIQEVEEGHLRRRDHKTHKRAPP